MNLVPAADITPQPTSLRNLTDWQADRLTRFVAKHPHYRSLPADILLQFADTYRDETDHTLEQDFRDSGVLKGCRADYKPAGRKAEEEDGSAYPLDSEPYYGRWEAI